jgi:hypothetical protein
MSARLLLLQRVAALSQDLATGYMSGKLLLKLEAVHYMLAHQNACLLLS